MIDGRYIQGIDGVVLWKTPNAGNAVNEWNVNANSATNSVNTNNAFNTNGVSPDLAVRKFEQITVCSVRCQKKDSQRQDFPSLCRRRFFERAPSEKKSAAGRQSGIGVKIGDKTDFDQEIKDFGSKKAVFLAGSPWGDPATDQIRLS